MSVPQSTMYRCLTRGGTVVHATEKPFRARSENPESQAEWWEGKTLCGWWILKLLVSYDVGNDTLAEWSCEPVTCKRCAGNLRRHIDGLEHVLRGDY